MNKNQGRSRWRARLKKHNSKLSYKNNCELFLLLLDLYFKLWVFNNFFQIAIVNRCSLDRDFSEFYMQTIY